MSASTPEGGGFDVVRLWAVSDIHTDIKENRQWIESLSDEEYQKDALLVAGDVSDRLDVLEASLLTLTRKFRTVFFTPGNHDLWLSPDDGDLDSMGKIRRIRELCARLGVATDARRIGPGDVDPQSAAPGVWVCPLLSWHHQSFDTEPDLQGWDIAPVESVMVDYHRCRFPRHLSMMDDSAALAVDSLNDTEELLRSLALRPPEEPLVTFSHFLPRLDLLLEKRFLTLPQLPKASGSRFLGERVQALRPDVHVFGHTHFGWDAVLDGVRYIQAALAYPGERRARPASLANADFGQGPLLIWSSDRGFTPKATCRWSGYYEHHPREPHKVFELAYYAVPYFQRTDARATECRPDFSHEASDVAQPHAESRSGVAPAG